jgi:hypothetical protein
MEAHLGCEICSAVWAEHNAATAELRNAVSMEARKSARERLQAATDAIHIHRVVAHLKAIHTATEDRKNLLAVRSKAG